MTLQRLLILYRFQILSLASTLYKNETIVEQQFTFTYCMVVHFFLCHSVEALSSMPTRLLLFTTSLFIVLDYYLRLRVNELTQSLTASATVGHFTFWISLSLTLSPSPKFGLTPKISQTVKSPSFELSDSPSISLQKTSD